MKITVRLTKAAGAKKTTVRFVDLGGRYSYSTDRSQYIMSRALPLLRQEFLKAQSANVELISGATDTSQAFAESLQSALAKLKPAGSTTATRRRARAPPVLTQNDSSEGERGNLGFPCAGNMGDRGFEPRTSALSERRSNQLS